MSKQAGKWFLAAGLVWVGCVVEAQTVRTKADNTDNLNLGSSWVGGAAPNAGQVAKWDSTVTGASSVLLGADLSYRGMIISDPGGTVTIGGANSLSTDMLGINMSAATADLLLGNANLILKDYACAVWNVTGGRTLTVNPSVFTRGSQSTLGIPGAGMVVSVTLTNDATGIVGPWASTGTGTDTKYATVSGGNIIGYTGTAAADATEVVDTIGVTNYAVAAVGTLGAGAAFNTLRYTGAAGTIGGAFTANGLLNAGEDTLTFSGDATVGPNRELVLTSPDSTRPLTLSGSISDDAGGASDVTVTGGGRVSLTGNNTYSGVTVIGLGILTAYHDNALGTADGNTVIYATGRTSDGGQLVLAGSVTLDEPVTIAGPGDGASGGYTRSIDAWNGTNTIEGTITLTGTTGYRIGVYGDTGTVLNLGLIQRSTTGGGSLIVDPGAGRILNFSDVVDNNGGDLVCHGGGGSGLTVLMASSNDLGHVRVQNDSSLKVTANHALAADRYLQIGQSSGNTATGTGNDRGVFYLDTEEQAIDELYGYPNASNASMTDRRKITSTTVGSKTLTVGSDNGSGSFDGVIEDGTGGGTISLVKTGTGNQTLAGTRDNTYTGITAVNNGTLALNKTAGTNSVSGDVFIGAGILKNDQNDQIADTATVTMTTATSRWLLNGKTETVANVDIQNADPSVNLGYVSGGGGTLTVTDTLTHTLGNITLNSSGSGGESVITANTLVNRGGDWTFGVSSGTQSLNIGSGGLTIGGGSMIQVDATVAVPNFISLGGDITSEADATVSTISGAGELRLNAPRDFDVAEGAAPVDLSISAIIADGTGSGAIIKSGSGTLSLSGVNTYTGGTAINEGTLAINDTGSLPGWDTPASYSVASNAALAAGNSISDSDVATLLGTGNFAAGANFGFDTTLGDREYSVDLSDSAGGMLGLVKVGANTLTLSGVNGYTGNTIINSGVLAITGTGALPGWNTAGRYTVAGGATLMVPNSVSDGDIATMLGTGNFAADATIGFDTTAGDRTYTPFVVNTANGALGVYKGGINQLLLSADNTYDGETIIRQGKVRITNENALGGTNGATVIYSTGSYLTGGQLQLYGGLTVEEPIEITGPGDGSPYHFAIQTPGGGGSNTLTGPVTINTTGGVRLGAGGSGTVLVFDGPFKRLTSGNTLQLSVGGNYGLVIMNTWIDNNGGGLTLPGGGLGVVQLNVASNNIGSVQIAGRHTLRLGVSEALAVNRQMQIGYLSAWADACRGSFDLAGYNQTINQLYGDGTAYPMTERVVTNSAVSISVLTLGNGNGSGTFNGVIGGNLSLTKVGTGTQTLGGPGSFRGETMVEAGVLRVTNEMALSQSTLVTSTGTFSIGDNLAACTLGGLTGAYDLVLANAAETAIELSVGNNGTDTIFSGALSGAGSLVKIGSGKLTLAGVNTYTGSTTLSEGTLALGCNNALGAGTQIILNGGTLDPGSCTNSLSALNISAAGGSIASGDGSGSLSFADSSGQSWDGQLNITYSGTWVPASLRFGTSAAALTEEQLSSIRFNGERDGVQLDAQGYLWRMTGTLIILR